MHSASGATSSPTTARSTTPTTWRRSCASGGHQLRGHCDTEVLIEAIDAWGLERTLGQGERHVRVRAVGPTRPSTAPRARPPRREASLLRLDGRHLPLRFRAQGACARTPPSVPRSTATRWRCTSGRTASRRRTRSTRHVWKLPPATVLTLDVDRDPREAAPVTYWSAVDAFDAAPRCDLTDDDAVDAVNELLLDATKIRMRSDVPLGAFLSGGVDSSVVVALMQAQSDQSVRTFTIGSANRTYNEADRAADIATHLGTRHSELIVTGGDALGGGAASGPDLRRALRGLVADPDAARGGAGPPRRDREPLGRRGRRGLRRLRPVPLGAVAGQAPEPDPAGGAGGRGPCAACRPAAGMGCRDRPDPGPCPPPDPGHQGGEALAVDDARRSGSDVSATRHPLGRSESHSSSAAPSRPRHRDCHRGATTTSSTT